MDNISLTFHLCCMQILKVFYNHLMRDRVNTLKDERKGKAPYTEKINKHVPSEWCVHSTFAYGDASGPLQMY